MFLLSIVILILGEDRDELLIDSVAISITVLVSVKLLTCVDFSGVYFSVLISVGHVVITLRESKTCVLEATYMYLECAKSLAVLYVFYTTMYMLSDTLLVIACLPIY